MWPLELGIRTPSLLRGPLSWVVRIPHFRYRAKVWECVSPTQGATQRRGSPCPQLMGTHNSVGVRILNSRRHTKAWESVSPTQDATRKCGSPYSQLKGDAQKLGSRYHPFKLKGPHKSVAVRIPPHLPHALIPPHNGNRVPFGA